MFLMPSENIEFSAERKKLLQETVISEQEPGTILQDMDSFLNYIQENNLSLSPQQQLSRNNLAKLNEILSNPIELGLKRPIPKSYPHIQGLFLLLRASGLTQVVAKGKKQFLKLEDSTYQGWQSLNATERYCNLLETWLLRGKLEIIGEYSRWGVPDSIDKWYWFYHRTKGEALQVMGNNDAIQMLKYYPGMHNIGLLDLFGFITVKRAPMKAGEAWQIDSIEHTDLGLAFFSLFVETFLKNIENWLAIQDLIDEQTGLLQPFLQAYFPDWKKSLSVSKTEFREGVYIFKVSLGKSVWSRIEIGAEQVLDRLASIILVAVNFDNDHLYQFSYRSKTGTVEEVKHPYTGDTPLTSEMRIGDLPLDVGQSMTYLFDFGDNWEFELVLEKIEGGNSKKSAKILEKSGEPPEQYPSWEDEY